MPGKHWKTSDGWLILIGGLGLLHGIEMDFSIAKRGTLLNPNEIPQWKKPKWKCVREALPNQAYFRVSLYIAHVLNGAGLRLDYTNKSKRKNWWDGVRSQYLYLEPK